MKNSYAICEMDIQNLLHISLCTNLNERKPLLPFEKVINGSLSEQYEIFLRFEHNLNKRTEFKN
jgi:hypothetical protein